MKILKITKDFEPSTGDVIAIKAENLTDELLNPVIKKFEEDTGLVYIEEAEWLTLSQWKILSPIFRANNKNPVALRVGNLTVEKSTQLISELQIIVTSENRLRYNLHLKP